MTTPSRSPRIGAPVLRLVILGEIMAFIALSVVAGLDPFWTPTQVWLIATFGLGGAFIVGRQPGNGVGRILWLIGAVLGLDTLASQWVITAATLGGPLPGVTIAAWFSNWSLSLVLALALGFLPLLFPTGTPPSPRWRRLLPLFAVITVLVPLGDMLRPGPVDIGPAHVLNPTGMAGPLDDALSMLGDVVPPVILPIVIAAGVSRYRNGGWLERQQLKWFTAAVSLTGIGLVSATTLGGVLGSVTLLPTLVALGFMPIAIGIAVTRYRLYAIDRIVSRTLAWAVITAILALVSGAVVFGLEDVLAGITQGQTLAVAASTLVAFALFQPVRRRVQSIVDRRFDRARYDGQRAVDAFAERLRGEVDLVAIGDEMLAVVGSTVRPRHESIWLRGGMR